MNPVKRLTDKAHSKNVSISMCILMAIPFWFLILYVLRSLRHAG